MHEIIYVQSGTYANYIGQHFWNVQESYFDWEEEPEEVNERKPPEVNHDISFREGLGTNGVSTYLPRVLIFDSKDVFGSIPKYNTMYESVAGEEANDSASWTGQSVSYQQPLHPKSQYQCDLDEQTTKASQTIESRRTYNPSTWADYTSVYYHPCSIWPVSYILTGTGNKWDEGEDAWGRLQHENDFWDKDFRLFAEECDLLQGLQATSSASDAFASLSASLLQTFRDEYPKLPALLFLPLSQRKEKFNPYDLAERRRLSTESKMLVMSAEAEATIIPLQCPATWSKGQWTTELALDLNFGEAYQSSALLSAHIESATLSLRLNSNPTSLSSLTSLLNYHTDTPISHLSGALPLYDTLFTNKIYDFSTVLDASVPDTPTFSACTTYRGLLSPQTRVNLTERLEQSIGIREPLLQLFIVLCPTISYFDFIPSYSGNSFEQCTAAVYVAHNLSHIIIS
ncbi:tubulin nucleotide-binding domain-like protein [Dacryopinax primogenitus]|uniref:Tubulin nucleotide-binding domain-like protein n=1 Tax=Dacryopinax primogenitus (strain DJM 731) TaxID=1858805 RepID=M5G9A7_DACPD|nr:tubulin nucleotide-binding domain-like protein [Dacryopinax primogenitus]EJU00373.1 tubulin nucleotide-binding domain-like protein [Dacryopinax primogenitus]